VIQLLERREVCWLCIYGRCSWAGAWSHDWRPFNAISELEVDILVLTVVAGVMLVIVASFLPETCRSVVGNGSIPPQPWNISLLSYLRQRKLKGVRVGPVAEAQLRTLTRRRRRPNPLEALSIATEKETGMVTITSALLYAGFFSVLISLPTQLQAKILF
jgi:hypothetical protein